MVLRRCRFLLRNEDDAVDAMQDVFVQLLRYSDRLTDEAPSSLLFRMATNVCLNRLRSARRHPTAPANDVLTRIAAAGDLAAEAAHRGLLGRIFGREPESTRLIAVLHLVDGMTLEEVAHEVKMSVSGVRKRLRTLRARVAELEGVARS